jgi:hypothetical protein
VALVRTDVSEEPGASFIRMTPFFIVTALKTSNLTNVWNSFQSALVRMIVFLNGVASAFVPTVDFLMISYSGECIMFKKESFSVASSLSMPLLGSIKRLSNGHLGQFPLS